MGDRPRSFWRQIARPFGGETGGRTRWALGGVIALVGVLVLATVVWPEPPPVPAALAVVDDDRRFDTALDASDAFAEISGLLATVECDAARSPRCARLRRAEAWAQVTAVLIVGCPPAQVFDARAGLGRYLRDRRGEVTLPSTPRCGARRQTSSS